MIWGLSENAWSPWFAWRPVRIWDGRWVWLQRVERTDYFNLEVPVHCFTNGGWNSWVARLPQSDGGDA